MAAINELFKTTVQVINVGLPSFHADLLSQNVSSVHVDWQPPAAGNARVAALLGRVRSWQTKVNEGKGVTHEKDQN